MSAIYKKWRVQQRWLTELFLYSYQEISRFNLFFLNHKYAINVLTNFHPKLFFRNIFRFVEGQFLKILKILKRSWIFIEVFSKMKNTIIIMSIMVIIRSTAALVFAIFVRVLDM